LTSPEPSTPQLVTALKCWFSTAPTGGAAFSCPRAATNSVRVGCALPALSQARLCSTAGPPSQRQGMRKRVNALLSTGSDRAASPQLLPPSAETKTLEIRPAPESLSYAFWYEEIARVAGGLTALGLRHGDRWLSSCRTGSKTASLHWACQLAGIVVTPLNWRIKPEELDYCLADADAAALVFDDVAADTVAGAAAVQRLPRIAIGNVDGTFVCMPRFDAAKDGSSACARAPPARRRDTCAGSRQINGRLVDRWVIRARESVAHANWSSSACASFRSAVSKPSVNQP
jgi:hypothetical protein